MNWKVKENVNFLLLVKAFNLALRFLLELCALAALGYWGFQNGNSTIMKFVSGITIPLLIALVWGAFGSPKAPLQLPKSFHMILELVLFGLPAVALYAANKPNLACIYLLVVVFNRILMYIWEQ
jgi:hypothetical protein